MEDAEIAREIVDKTKSPDYGAGHFWSEDGLVPAIATALRTAHRAGYEAAREQAAGIAEDTVKRMNEGMIGLLEKEPKSDKLVAISIVPKHVATAIRSMEPDDA